MKATLTVGLLLLAACLAAIAQTRTEERVLNLKGLQPFTVKAYGVRLFLSVTGQPPAIVWLINTNLMSLKRRDPSGGTPKFQILLGKDILGLAEISGVSKHSLPLTVGTNATKLQFTSVELTFETQEQAAGAAHALRPSDAPPPPLQRQQKSR